MNYQQIIGLIRQAITAIGVFLVTFGWASQDTITQASTSFEAIIGGIIVLISVGSSIWAKRKGGQDNPTIVQVAAKEVAKDPSVGDTVQAVTIRTEAGAVTKLATSDK